MHVQITNQIAKSFEMQYHKKGLIDCFNFLDVERPLSRISKNFPVLGVPEHAQSTQHNKSVIF